MSENKDKAQQICFGFDRATDEQSLILFLEQFTNKKLLNTLIPRLDDEDISTLVFNITQLMRKHLKEKEYHQLFLDE